MKILKKIIILIFIPLISCKTTDPNTFSKKPKNFKIIVGMGGGVSGFYSEYWLNHEGQVIQKNFDSETTRLIKKIDKSHAYDFYRKLLETGFLDIKLNNTGNINYYIELQSEGKSHKIQWGKPNTQLPPSNIQEYFDNIFSKLSSPAN